MLARKSLCLAAIRYIYPTNGVWSSTFKTLPISKLGGKKWTAKPSLATAYSKDSKPEVNPASSFTENPSDSNSSSLKSVPPFDNLASNPKSSSYSDSNTTEESKKTETEKTSTGTLNNGGVKLPSKDQVEDFVFKFLVYVWDFIYYVYCFGSKLFDTYIINNPTVQQYWKQLLKRMDEARKQLKTK